MNSPLPNFESFDDVKDKLVLRTVNVEEESPPFRPIAGDIGNIVVIQFDITGTTGGERVDENLLSEWGKSFDDVYDIAEDQTTNMEIVMADAGSVWFGLPPSDTGDTGLYVVTNQFQMYGFVQAVLKLDSIHSKIGKDFYIIPSSVHEALIAPMGDEMVAQDIVKTIQEVNRTVVSEEDFLSNKLFQCNFANGLCSFTEWKGV